ncbi:MAG: DUF1610 domain-containing protein [Archaeoglobales archaeon]|nr:zinc finger domain-containing protein [Archaeoglobi archaeon]NHW23571.1 DUF1610 domain-containing protein [Archaeoglobales archaeon]TDA30280.1 MAG: RNA-binding protein [Archaeoglobi archaeon]
MEITRCISCGSMLVGAEYVSFPCPNCGERINRCKRCRRLSNKYRCSCGFVGP